MIFFLLISIFLLQNFSSAYPTAELPYSKLATGEIFQAMESEGYTVIYPYNKNYTCFHSSTIHCHRLNFRLKEEDSRSPLFSRFLIFKPVTSKTQFQITWPKDAKDGSVEKSWLSFNTSSCLRKIGSKRFKCSIEVTGMVDGEIEKHSPFLAVSSDSQNHRRTKRMSGMSTCTLKERYVSTKDLGRGHAQIPSINIGMCVGECHIDSGTPLGSLYAKTMYLSFKRNKTHIPEETWRPSCQITGMRSINLFFSKTVGNETVYEEHELKNMIVTSCGCQPSNCYMDML